MTFYVKRCSSSEGEIKHSDDELQHFGILGMKWGVRRYQNPDGTLTAEGRAHYGVGSERKFSPREQSENYKRFKKYSKRAELDPVLYERFVSSNKDLLDKYADNNKRRLEMIASKGADAVVKYAEESVKNGDVDPDDAYSFDNYDAYDAEEMLSRSYPEFNKFAGAAISAMRDLRDCYKEAILDYTGRLDKAGAASSAAFGLKVEEKYFKDKYGRDQMSYEEEFNKDLYNKLYKKQAMVDAENRDQYNIDFLESIQNKTYLGDDSVKSRKKRLTEYKKFLEDPMNYEPPAVD